MKLPISKNHQDRLVFAKGALETIKKRFGPELMGVAIYGSVAKERDLPFSDVELLAVLRSGKSDSYHEGIVNGLKCGVKVISRDKIVEEISEIDLKWPIRVGKYLELSVLFDEMGVFDEFKRKFDEVTGQDFRNKVRQIFVEDVYEELCKLMNTSYVGDDVQKRLLAINLFEFMTMFLGVVNKHYYGSVATRGVDALALPVSFPSFQQLGKMILSGDLANAGELPKIAERLMEEILAYLDSLGTSYVLEKFVIS